MLHSRFLAALFSCILVLSPSLCAFACALPPAPAAEHSCCPEEGQAPRDSEARYCCSAWYSARASEQGEFLSEQQQPFADALIAASAPDLPESQTNPRRELLLRDLPRSERLRVFPVGSNAPPRV